MSTMQNTEMSSGTETYDPEPRTVYGWSRRQLTRLGLGWCAALAVPLIGGCGRKPVFPSSPTGRDPDDEDFPREYPNPEKDTRPPRDGVTPRPSARERRSGNVPIGANSTGISSGGGGAAQADGMVERQLENFTKPGDLKAKP